MPSLAITLFGSFQATLYDQPIRAFRSQKGRALLAYLVLAQSKPITRTTLAELLWPHYTAVSARTNLRQVLANLREILAPLDLLQSNYKTIQLLVDPAMLHCDVLLFDELFDACQRHEHLSLAQCPLCQSRLQQATDLYKGAFWENFDDVDSAPFQAWLTARRAHYAARFTEIQALRRPATVPRGNLPRPITSFLGRTAELAQLTDKLLHPIYRCLTLIGPGGIGKSRLAIALAEQMRPAFLDGVWFVALAAESSKASAKTHLLDRIATTISMALRLPFHGVTHPAQQVTDYLRDKTLLLIVDNFEHLSDGVDLLVALLQEAPNLRLVVTSRHRLAFQAQLVHQVAGLALPLEKAEDLLPPDQLIERYASLHLFVERAENAQFPLERNPSTLATISALCRVLEGVPLAIELAATLLEKQTPDEILQAVRTHYAALQANLSDLPQRQRSAQAVLLTAWDLLSVQEAQTLARCSVFRGGFTLTSAQQIIGVMQTDLEALINKSLLHIDDTNRYTLHELVRQFAAEQLTLDEAAAQTLHERYATYYLALLEQWQLGTEHAFRQVIQQEIANVEAAWDWALAHTQVRTLLAALPALQLFYRLACRFHQAEMQIVHASSQVRRWLASELPNTSKAEAGIQLLMQLLLKQCELYNHYLPQPTQVITLAQEVIQRGEQLGRNDLVAEGYAEWSLALFALGNFTEQRQVVERALPLVQAQHAPVAQIKTLFSLGTNAQGQHDFAAAIIAHQQALSLALTYQDALLALRILNHMAMAYRDSGDLEQALSYFQQNLQVAQQLEQANEMAYATANFGLVNLQLGNFSQAERYLEAARQVFSDQGERRLVAELDCVLGLLFQQTRSDDRAIACCQQTLALAIPYQYYHAQRTAYEILGKVYLCRGEITQAETVYHQLMDLLQRMDNTADLVYVQIGLASVHSARQDDAAALTVIEPALAHLTQKLRPTVDHPDLLLSCYHVLAAAYDVRAASVLQQAWQIVQSQATKISEPALRASFLTNVPVNRELGRLVAQMPATVDLT